MTNKQLDQLDIVLELQGVSHNFGPKNVLHDLNLKIIRGETVALVGPSGCGKSTLLRAILGTHLPAKGKVVVSSKDGTLRSVAKPGRDRGIVYQRYSLFPFLTAAENVAFGLVLDETSIPFRICRPFAWHKLKKGYMDRARELLIKLGLEGSANHYPHELSGGMCQRVAIAQALIIKPQILLLDEPFGALDEATREALQRMLLVLYEENQEAIRSGDKPPNTIMIVTHEINEAIYVSDRVVGLSQYWNWQVDGHGRFPGATLVYDKVAPVHHPDDERDFLAFAEQRDDILHQVCDENYLQMRNESLQFWQQVKNGDGQGVLANGN
jgi:NitT/TauT family transport system ATP-binding protein